jgi:hypothetical protein
LRRDKKQLMFAWVILVLSVVSASGCALIGTALSAAAAYGIYQATKK